RVSTFTTLSTARLIHNCRGLNRQAALGHFSIGRVGQFSISADTESTEARNLLQQDVRPAPH
ncbi:hypothetical protein, partial [Pseudomonas sp. CAH-1]|uniref:hypothetical protein n=1 Tax=Pseudomonas sp. CAH-1 TaxID=2605744 RepID=UPI001EEA8F20